jgi:hypothetical protein
MTDDARLDAVEADLILARGRIRHAEFLVQRQEDTRELAEFERAAELYADLGDERGEAEALFWVGIVHQVVRGDGATALPFFERSYARWPAGSATASRCRTPYATSASSP